MPGAKKTQSALPPSWYDCTWKRLACGKKSCRVCGAIMRQRERHLNQGRDPDSPEAIHQDMEENFSRAFRMLKNLARRKHIRAIRALDVPEPPSPRNLPLFRKAQKFQNDLAKTLPIVVTPFGEPEALQDLRWYSMVLPAKIYRAFCAHWFSEHGHTNTDLELTLPTIRQIFSILYDSFANAREYLAPFQAQLFSLEAQLMLMEEVLTGIFPGYASYFAIAEHTAVDVRRKCQK